MAGRFWFSKKGVEGGHPNRGSIFKPPLANTRKSRGTNRFLVDSPSQNETPISKTLANTRKSRVTKHRFSPLAIFHYLTSTNRPYPLLIQTQDRPATNQNISTSSSYKPPLAAKFSPSHSATVFRLCCRPIGGSGRSPTVHRPFYATWGR